ncbi:hypothetical protein G7Y89_g3858 [Cudoniella acicularis]|uniref:chitinase n=1 Tax=Cudoniella acicularis TaxID=354080 RepID=A0A8H4RRE1_9HELO|nr:hypothetical protein G7Y89_g3858 [Cudoniella acicularis]
MVLVRLHAEGSHPYLMEFAPLASHALMERAVAKPVSVHTPQAAAPAIIAFQIARRKPHADNMQTLQNQIVAQLTFSAGMDAKPALVAVVLLKHLLAAELQRQPESLVTMKADLTGLSHLNFAFAFFDPKTFKISPMDSTSAPLYSRFTFLKKKKTSLKTWISIGGWSFNNDGNSPSTRTAYSNMVSTTGNRQMFISSLTSFMITYGFDGVDIDWEYPGADDRGGLPADTANFVSLVKELRAAFGSNYGITVTLPSSFWYLQHFDIVTMQNYVDWFNFMSYDIHGVWDSTNKYTGPYICPHTNLTEIKDGLSLMWRAGVTPEKVVLGLGWYGRSFTLTDPNCNKPNGICQFSSGGNPGSCTDSAGTLSNAEIKRILASSGAVQSFDPVAAVKWATWGTNQWVSYDDGQTMQLKIAAANSLCLAGIMIWSIDQDNTDGDSMNDLLGVGIANGATEAQAQDYKNQLNNASFKKAIGDSCYWSLCGERCQGGYFDVAEVRGQVAGVLKNSICAAGNFQTLCCAPGTTLGSCKWEGWRGVGMPCTPVCSDLAAAIVAQNSNSYGLSPEGLLNDLTCTGGYQAFCCSGFKPSTQTNTGNLLLYGQGTISKRSVNPLHERGGRGVGMGLTLAICIAAVVAMIAGAPITFGLSLIGIPAEIELCAAAGIVIAVVGFAVHGSESGQRNPNGSPGVNDPRTGTPITVTSKNGGLRSSYGQWPILGFPATSFAGCDCSVTYTCRYNLGWDEICDNQRWAITELLNKKSVYTPAASGRAPLRNYRSWAQNHKDSYRTLVQGQRAYWAQCQVDEFPMGNLIDSGNNNPQACRLVNGVANQAQGGDWNMWKMAQWTPCSSFRQTVCKKKDPTKVTWEFGPLNGNRGPRRGKHIITAYGFDSQTPNALCFASFTYTGQDNRVSNTMVEDHGFRVLGDDPMFYGAGSGWQRQNYIIDPAPKANERQRPTSMGSAAFLKRDVQEAVGFSTEDYETMSESFEDYLEAHNLRIEDMSGNPIAAESCDLLYDDYSESTVLLSNENGFVETVTVTGNSRNSITSVNAASPTSGASEPRKSLGGTFPIATRSAVDPAARTSSILTSIATSSGR